MVVLFVGQSCCSTHESVLFLFSSELITHENMPFGGKKKKGGLSEVCQVNKIGR